MSLWLKKCECTNCPIHSIEASTVHETLIRNMRINLHLEHSELIQQYVAHSYGITFQSFVSQFLGNANCCNHQG